MGTPTTASGSRTKAMRWTSTLLVICGMILCFDIGGELHALYLYPASYGAMALVHLATELLGTLGVGWAFVLTRSELRRSLAEQHDSDSRLKALRGDFDRLMRQRFQDWGLSPAESDVALLTMRGMKISDIARMRQTHDGTIKSQLSVIYRKSKVSTRTEFVARFIDEFLDHSTSTAPHTS